MKPHLVSEIRKGIRDILVRRSPQVAALGCIPDGRITEEIMGILLKYIPVEHGNRGEPESEFFACSEDDIVSTGFEATSPNGTRVSGAVCSGVFKGATIRF